MIMSDSEISVKKPSGKWTEEQTYKFVQEYIKYPCLYDAKLPSYKNRMIKNVALLKISEFMNLPDFGRNEAYNKIRNIKSTYSQELKKIKDSSKFSISSHDVYFPKLKWFELLHGTLNSNNIEPRKTQTNPECKEEPPEYILYDLETSDEIPGEGSDSVENEEPPRKKCSRDINGIVDKVNNVSHSSNILPVNNSVNEFDVFGSSVAAQLKSMPLHLALKTEMYIQNLLSTIRIDQLHQGTTTDAGSLRQSSLSSWISSSRPPPFASPESPGADALLNSSPTFPLKQSPF